MNYVYFSATLDAAVWGAELASGEGPGRIYIVEPTGEFEDDPNVTDKKFPGNPTRSSVAASPCMWWASLSTGSVIRPRSSRPCEPHSIHCSEKKRRRSRTNPPRGRCQSSGDIPERWHSNDR